MIWYPNLGHVNSSFPNGSLIESTFREHSNLLHQETNGAMKSTRKPNLIFRYTAEVSNTELLYFIKVIPRKWFLASTPQAAASDNPEQCNMQNFSNLNSVKIKPCSLMPKQTYSGDRFIPCRSRCDFEAAHYLLKKRDDTEDKRVLDVFEQLGSLEITHRREALHTAMVKQGPIPGLKQNKILHFSNSTPQSQSPSRLNSQSKKERSWKCTSRKRALIGSAEKILCMPDPIVTENISVVDWSSNDMIAVGSQIGLTIHNDDGAALMTFRERFPTIVKWSNDGKKLALCVFTTHDVLLLYNIEKQKLLWYRVCKCVVSSRKNGCDICCICWSLYDLHVITGCTGTISVYASDTGKLLHSSVAHTSHIMNLSFSPNFNYLVSIGDDGSIRMFTWPGMVACFNMVSQGNIQTIAWHPRESNLLCIGGKKNGTLLLWDVKANTKIGRVRTKFDASVENLLWNALSGELVVHWSYKKEDDRCTVVPVLASFNRIVDVLPLDNDVKPMFMKFNSTQEQLITYCQDVFTIWNFFGNEKSYKKRYVTLCNSAQRRQGVIVHNPIR